MNTYNLILDYIDEINDSVVTTESNVIKSLMNSYYKQYELFTECEYLGKDPYKIYQEASIMDEVKEKSSKDKNKLISIVKLVPRLIIALINKIKNKLFKKGNNITNVDKQTIEETRKAVSNSKTGKIVLGGGVTVAALATGGLVISKVIKNKGKSSTKVEVEITKDNRVKCDFDIKAIKELVNALVGDMKKVMEQYKDPNVQKVSESMVNNITKNTEKLNDELKKENKNGNKVEVKSGDSNIESIVADLQYVKDNMGAPRIWEKDEALVKYIERLPAAVNAVETAINKFADLNSIVQSLREQQSSGGKGSNSEKKHQLSHNNADTLKTFVDKVSTKIVNIKDVIPDERYKNVQEAIEHANGIVSSDTKHHHEEIIKEMNDVCYAIYQNIYYPEIGQYRMDILEKYMSPKCLKVTGFLLDIGFKPVEINIGDPAPDKWRKYFENIHYTPADNDEKVNVAERIIGQPYVIHTDDIGGLVDDNNSPVDDVEFCLKGRSITVTEGNDTVSTKSKTTGNVNDDAKNLKKFVDTVKNKLPDIKSTIDEEDYDDISTAINDSYKIIEGLTDDDSDEDLGKKHKIIYNIHSAINSMCKNTPKFGYIIDKKAGGFRQSDTAKVIEKFLVDVGYRKMTDEFKVGDDLKKVYNKALDEWFKYVETIDGYLSNELNINVKPGQIAMIVRYPYILDMDKLKLRDSTKKHFTIYRDQGMLVIKGGRIYERVENKTIQNV